MSLNNSQYDTLIRQYNARQFHNQHLLDERIQEVYGKCPRLTEIDFFHLSSKCKTTFI